MFSILEHLLIFFYKQVEYLIRSALMHYRALRKSLISRTFCLPAFNIVHLSYSFWRFFMRSIKELSSALTLPYTHTHTHKHTHTHTHTHTQIYPMNRDAITWIHHPDFFEGKLRKLSFVKFKNKSQFKSNLQIFLLPNYKKNLCLRLL